MSSSKEVKSKENTMPVAINYEGDSGAGFETADLDSFAVPFLVVLQKLSPQCDDDSPKRMADAKPGMLFNTVNEKLYAARMEDNAGIPVVPVAFKRQFIEWGPRDSGKGLVAIYDVAEGLELQKHCTRDDKNRLTTPQGNLLADTRMHFVLAKDGEDWLPMIVSMSSTQIKNSKKWMALMDNIKFVRGDGTKYTPAMFSHIYKLSTQHEENAQGTWRGWKVSLVGRVEDLKLYDAARAFRDQIMANQVEVQFAQANNEDDMASEI